MIVLIDGDCALCVGLVEWLGKRIPPANLTPDTIVFVPGESDWGQELLAENHITDFDSIVVLTTVSALTEGDAVLALAGLLPLRWRVIANLARIAPRRLRNSMYRWVARNRIGWFGRKDQCAIDPNVGPVVYGPRGRFPRP